MAQSQQELDIFANRVLSGVSTVRKIGSAISNTTDDTTTVRRRWGVVLQVNATVGTIDARIDGMILPDLRTVSWYSATIGETVIIEYAGNDPICIGPVGYSAPNRFARADHTHATTSLPIPQYTQFRTLVGNFPSGYNGNQGVTISDDLDELIYDMGGNVNLVTIKATPGATRGLTEGRILKLKFITHSRKRTVNFPDAEDFSVSVPTTTIPPFEVAKDSIAISTIRWDTTNKRWQLDNFTNDFPRKTIPLRPSIRQRWAKAGVGTSLSLTTGQAYPGGSVVILIHCNDYGYWGEMQAPSGTIPAANWTFIGGGGKDFAAHVNYWAAVLPTGGGSNFTATVNQTFSFSTEMFIYMVDNVQFPKASHFKLMSSASPINRQFAIDVNGFTPQTTYESLQLTTWSYADKTQITNMFGDLQGDDTVASPLLVDSSDANGTHSTGLSTNRLIDVPATQWQIYTDTSNLTDYAAGTLILPVIS